MEIPRSALGLKLLATRSDTAIDEVAAGIRGAQTTITGEHFVLTDPAVIGALGDASQRGAAVTLLADPLMVQDGMFRAPAGVAVTPHGGLERKVHTKLTTVDGERSLFATVAMSAAHRADPNIDFVVESRGAAGLLDEMSRAGASGDRDRIVATAGRAAQAGFLLNDPANGVYHLRQGLHSLAEHATGDAFVGSKIIDDHKLLRWLRRGTEKAGGTLRIETHGGTDRGKAGRRQAKEAGARAGAAVHRLKPGSDGVKLHANVVAAQTQDGPRMVLMTAPATKRGMGDREWPIRGRELGVMVSDRAIIRRVLDEIGTLDGSDASAFADRLLR